MLHALSRNFAPIKVQRGEKSANKRIVLPVAPRLKRSATRHHHFNYRNIFPTGRGRTEYKSHPSTSKYKYRSIVSIEKRNANSTPTGQVSSFFPFLSFFLFLFFFKVGATTVSPELANLIANQRSSQHSPNLFRKLSSK